MIGEACGKQHDPSHRTRSQKEENHKEADKTAQSLEAGGSVGQKPTSLALEGRLSWRQSWSVVWEQKATARRSFHSLFYAEARN